MADSETSSQQASLPAPDESLGGLWSSRNAVRAVFTGQGQCLAQCASGPPDCKSDGTAILTCLEELRDQHPLQAAQKVQHKHEDSRGEEYKQNLLQLPRWLE
jgi:hypothetical protein